MFVPIVYASEDITFSEEYFKSYLEKNGYLITENECLGITDYDKDCYFVSAVNIKGSSEKTIELYVFNTNEGAFNYFSYIYEDSKEYFSNSDIYNLDNLDNSNYSYIKTELSDLYYFYCVRFNNYVIKSNIEIKNHNVMDKIYDGLNLIENNELGLKETTSNNNFILVFIVILDLLSIFLLIFVIVNKKVKNRKSILIVLSLVILFLSIIIFIGKPSKLFLNDKDIMKYELLS